MKYILSALSAGILWGGISIFLKPLNKYGISNIQLMAFKSIITLLFELVVVLATRQFKSLKIHLKDLWIFLAAGILSITCFQICYFHSILELGASTSVVLLYTGPIWVVIFSAILFKEKITRQKIIALILTFTGCICIAGFSKQPISTKGLLIGLAAGLGYACYTIFGRFALEKYNSHALVFYSFLCNGLSVIPFMNLPDFAAKLNGTVLLLLILFAFFNSAVPYTLYSYGLSGLENSTAAIFATVEPLVGSLVGFILWKEEVSAPKIAGIFLILIAIFLLGLKKSEKK